MEQDDILWIEPIPKLNPGKPGGFAVRILKFLGRGDPDPNGAPRFWTRVIVMNPSPGGPCWLNLLLPDDQPNARPLGAGRYGRPPNWSRRSRQPHPFERRLDPAGRQPSPLILHDVRAPRRLPFA
jgi:hypothetical protein